MEEADVASLDGARARAGSILRLAVVSAVIAAAALLVGWTSIELIAGVGAAAGCLAAGVYAWSFIRSHLGRAARSRFFDGKGAGAAGMRMVALGVVGAALFFVSREAFIAYLIGFGVCFAILLATEAPRVAREIQGQASVGSR